MSKRHDNNRDQNSKLTNQQIPFGRLIRRDDEDDKDTKTPDRNGRVPIRPDMDNGRGPGRPDWDYGRRPGRPDWDYGRSPGRPGWDYGRRPGRPDRDYDGRPGRPDRDYDGRPGRPGRDYDGRPGRPGRDYDGRPGRPGRDYDGRPGRRPSDTPPGPPPSSVPTKREGYGLYAVDPGSIRFCQYKYTYIWLNDGRAFWTWLVYVGRRSVAGYRWSRRTRSWAFFGTDIDNISEFECY